MNRRFPLILSSVLVALIVAEWLWTPHYHPVFPWHHWPGFFAFIGLVGCLVVLKLSKLLGQWFLQRPEESDA